VLQDLDGLVEEELAVPGRLGPVVLGSLREPAKKV
jgi:hypothetical protein